MIANVDGDKYEALLATARPGVITNVAEPERLTEVVNRLAHKGVKENHLSPEEEKLLVLLTRLIEDHERKSGPMNDAALEEA